MSSFGLLPTGFVAKSQDQIEESMDEGMRDRVSPTLDLGEATRLGELVGITSQELADLWNAAQAVNAGFSPESATGERLDQLMALIGLTRLAATPSTVNLRLNLDNGTTVLTGAQVSNSQTGEIFETTEDITNSSGITADFDVPAQSLDTGRIRASAGLLTVIETPVGGWNSVTNLLDAVLGREDETDTELRSRRLSSLAVEGNQTLEAILANLLGTNGVIEAFILENDTSLDPDANGIPTKSFESVVDGGDDTEVAQAIFAKKPLAIQAFGSTTVVLNDSQGFPHVIGFSRPDEVAYFIEIDVTVDPLLYGDGNEPIGNQLVAEALADFGQALGIGQNILMTLFECQALEIQGVLNVTGLRIDTFAPPVNTADIIVPFRQSSLFDTSRVTVNVTP